MRAASRLSLGLALALAAGGLAHAQAGAGDKKQDAVPAVTLGEKLAPEHLLGDWGGLLTRLGDRGVDLTASYESETAAVVSGGKRRGVDYAHSLNLEADVDWSKLANLTGFSTHLALVERAGRNASADFLGESLTQAQEIYGSGGSVGVHLAYLYAQEKLLGGKLDIEGGRLDVGQDFDASPLYCEFMTLSVCPQPRGLTLAPGFTIFPTSTWGGRVRGRPFGPVYVQIGAYQVRQAGGGPSGFDFSVNHTTGAIMPVEIGSEPQFGPDKLLGHYKVGLIYNTSSFRDFGPPTDPVAGRHGQAAWYIAVDQMIRRTGPDGSDGVILLAGYSHNDPHTAVIAEQAFAGVLANGVIPARPRDSVGAQVTWLQVSGDLAATQQVESQSNEPLSSGLETVAAPPPGVQSHEIVVEARYDVGLREGLHLMPDAQYVIRPDAAAAVSDGAVLSLRILADF